MAPKKIAVRKPVARALDAESKSLQDATETLFGTAENPLILCDGKTIVIGPAKTKHLGILLDFFFAILVRMNKEQLVAIVETIEKHIRKNARLTDGTKEPVSLEEVIGTILGRGSLILSLFHATFEVLPTLVEAVANISGEEFGELDTDEGVLVAATVFMVNYDFFSRNLPLALQALAARASDLLQKD